MNVQRDTDLFNLVQCTDLPCTLGIDQGRVIVHAPGQAASPLAQQGLAAALNSLSSSSLQAVIDRLEAVSAGPLKSCCTGA
ncbi:hypothetical protein [Pseudomonas phage vB_PaS-HSN4]|nr:hypothetical protein [Pseudomonas phage vB_PaS-HSN4]